MDREFYQAKARQESINAAKVSKRPLGIWPGDEGHIAVDDLPEVSSEYLNEHPVDGTQRVLGRGTPELRVGKRYGILTRQYSYEEGMREVIIGRWDT